MPKTGDYDDYGYLIQNEGNFGPTGAAHNVSGEPKEENRVDRLREVVAEITRGRIPVAPKRGPGFY